MSTYLYDDALVNKIRGWTKDTQLQVYGPDEVNRLFTVVADETKDSPIKLPMIAISRETSYTVGSVVKRPLSHKGIPSSIDRSGAVLLNAIPIRLLYQVDIITRHYKESDEYCRNFIFNIINFPKIQVEIPYFNQNLLHDSSITLSPDINNTSSFSIRQVPGQLYRYTLKLSIEDAYLWDVRKKDNLQLTDIQLYVNDETEKEWQYTFR